MVLDDVALFAEEDCDAAESLRALAECASRLGLRINTAKTKVFGTDTLTLQCEQIERVDSFTYLGSVSPTDDINVRIGKATTTFARLRKALWTNDKLPIEL